MIGVILIGSWVHTREQVDNARACVVRVAQILQKAVIVLADAPAITFHLLLLDAILA